VWPKLRFSLGYPPCYPSPVLIASSSASSPHSSSLRALSAIRCGYARGRATLVLARNCSSALVALGSPRSRPCGCSSAAAGLITHPAPDPCRACFVVVAIFGIQREEGVLSPLLGHNLHRLHPLGPGSDVGVLQWPHVLTSVENTGLLDVLELSQL